MMSLITSRKKSGAAEYLEGVTDRQKVGGNAGVGLDGNHGDEDELFEAAKEIIVKAGKASTSMLQRRLSIGYGRAAKILDMLEEAGIIGPSNGAKPREVMISREQYEAMGAVSATPLHKREEMSAPDNYLGEEIESDEEEEGNDDTLIFKGEPEEETDESEAPIVPDEPAEEAEIKEASSAEADSEEVEKEEPPAKPKTPSSGSRPFEDDDEMFFAK